MVLGSSTSSDMLNQTRNQNLSHIHNIINIGIGHIELAGSKLWVVSEINTLISELTTHLIDTVETTNNQHLEVQLWCNTHEHIHVQVVVVSLERLGGSSSCDGVHHWSLDLDKLLLVEVSADVADHLGASDEDVAGGLVHDQIEIALAVTLFLVLEAVVLVWKLVKTWCEQNDLRSKDR